MSLLATCTIPPDIRPDEKVADYTHRVLLGSDGVDRMSAMGKYIDGFVQGNLTDPYLLGALLYGVSETRKTLLHVLKSGGEIHNKRAARTTWEITLRYLERLYDKTIASDARLQIASFASNVRHVMDLFRDDIRSGVLDSINPAVSPPSMNFANAVAECEGAEKMFRLGEFVHEFIMDKKTDSLYLRELFRIIEFVRGDLLISRRNRVTVTKEWAVTNFRSAWSQAAAYLGHLEVSLSFGNHGDSRVAFAQDAGRLDKLLSEDLRTCLDDGRGVGECVYKSSEKGRPSFVSLPNYRKFDIRKLPEELASLTTRQKHAYGAERVEFRKNLEHAGFDTLRGQIETAKSRAEADRDKALKAIQEADDLLAQFEEVERALLKS